MQRRQFVKNAASASALVMVSPSVVMYGNGFKTKSEDPWNLLPFMLFEDVAKLAAQSPELNEKFKQAIAGNLHHPVEGNLARLAWAQKDNKVLAKALLEQVCRKSDTRSVKWENEKLSFVLGWLIFTSSVALFDRELAKFPPSIHRLGTIKMYQEAYLLVSRYGKGTEIHQGKSGSISEALRGILARVITRIHTLNPSNEEGDDWAVQTSQWRNENKALMDSYDEAIFHPDEQKINQYCRDINVYSPTDPLIASSFTFGTHLDKNTSLYAKAVTDGYNAIIEFQAYACGNTTKKPIT